MAYGDREKGVGDRLAEAVGYVSVDVKEKEERELVKRVEHRVLVETIRVMLFEDDDRYSVFSDDQLTHFWEKREGETGDAWRIVCQLMRNVRLMGGRITGYDPDRGPDIVIFDPEKHKIYDYDWTKAGARERFEAFKGQRAVAVAPGLIVDGEDVVFTRYKVIPPSI